MQYARPANPAGSAGALPLFFVFIFTVFAGVAWVLYSQLQPTVRPNPGVAAYKAPPATIVASAPPHAPSQAGEPLADFAQAKPEAPAQPVAEITDAPAKPVAEARPADPAPVAEVKKKRKVAKHRRPRDPTSDYAAQNNNGYRPWSDDRSAQRSGGYRPWF